MKLEEISRREMMKGLAAIIAEPTAPNGSWLRVLTYNDPDSGKVSLSIDPTSIKKVTDNKIEFRVKKVWDTPKSKVTLSTYTIDLNDKTISSKTDGRSISSPVNDIKPGSVNSLMYDFVIHHLK